MAFDRQWWGICNFEWALYYREENRLPPFNCLLENERFFALDCGLSYPIVGAFTEYLLLTYGTERYRLFWQKENGGEEGFWKAYGKTTGELSREFEQYLNSMPFISCTVYCAFHSFQSTIYGVFVSTCKMQ